MQKKIDSFEKQAEKAIADKLLNNAKVLNSLADKDSKLLVHVFENGANGKALDSALKQLNKYSAVIGFSINENTKKVVVVAKVDKVNNFILNHIFLSY